MTAPITTLPGKPQGPTGLWRITGFKKGYNLAIWLGFGSLAALFSMYRMPSISINHFCVPGNSIPGDCVNYDPPGRHRTGIWLHLASILPASLLALTQFLPAIRAYNINIHRFVGYTVWTLSVAGSVGLFMLLDEAAGGHVETQAIGVVLTCLFLGSTIRAAVAIKQLHIDQHRAWMLRSWIYAWCIVTMRPVFILLALAASKLGNFHVAMPCYKIEYVIANAKVPDPNITLATTFPDCAAYISNTDPTKMAIVRANLLGSVVERAAVLNMSFGTATWIAIVIHAVLVELYVSLSPSPPHQASSSLTWTPCNRSTTRPRRTSVSNCTPTAGA